MYNLIRFLVRYHALFLFILLEIVCAFIIIQNNNYQKSSYLNSANVVTGSLFQLKHNATSYFRLRDVNDSLMHENALLRNQLMNAVKDDGIRRYTIYDSLDDNYRQVFTYTEAYVINNSINKATNFFFIDRGTKHGIEPEMGVITLNGVVGVIVGVSNNNAVAMSLLHRNLSISAMLEKQQVFGHISWDGQSTQHVILSEIPHYIEVEAGDQIITSGYSNLFPKGISIGYVESTKTLKGTNFQEIVVRLNNDFHSLSYVYVVENMMIEEIHQLEELIEADG